MKVMNEVKAGKKGTIAEMLVATATRSNLEQTSSGTTYEKDPHRQSRRNRRRIIRACHDMGMQTVAVYSQADTEALHVFMRMKQSALEKPHRKNPI